MASLALVHVLILIHVTHWLLSGTTLAPLELNEVMYTFELGIVTAGFVFMATAVLATALFGRFFCSWACHVLALQDLCAWMLTRLRVRPKGIRSRTLAWVPVVAALYMFAWPQVVRAWEGRALPQAHVTSDADGWASFSTQDFWRNLPGAGVAVMTLAVCGFGIIYVLGSRSFCSAACPYGAVFRLMDRFSPGRIRVGGDCKQCGTCTAVCSSHVRVHEELNRYGMVVDSACMKDLDCISACPQQSLHYGFGRPSLLALPVAKTPVRKQYDFAAWEEALMAVFFVAVLLTYRGLYDRIPFLMSLGLGCIVSYFMIVTLRLLRQPQVKFNRWVLKSDGHLRGSGRLFAGLMTVLIVFSIHSAVIRYHTFQGRRDFIALAAQDRETAGTSRAISHFEFVQRWGLLSTPRVQTALAELYTRRERWADCVKVLMPLIDNGSAGVVARVSFAAAIDHLGQHAEALRQFNIALALAPDHVHTLNKLAEHHFRRGRPVEAAACMRAALRARPGFAPGHCELGALLIEIGKLDEGILHLRRAIALNEQFADAHYNLAVALATSGDLEEASKEIARAAQLNPRDEQTQAFRSHLAKFLGPPSRPRPGFP